MTTHTASEAIALLGVVDPDATGASTVTTGWIDASRFDRFLAVVSAGTLGSSATVNAKLEQASDSSGTGVKDITGKAITEITQAGTDQSDTQALIDLRQTELDLTNDFTHFRLSITVGTASSDVCGHVFGYAPIYGPASNFNATTVGEVV